MADWTQEQIAGAGNWIRDNVGNQALVQSEAARLGLNPQTVLQAAQTQAPGISQQTVNDYMGYSTPMSMGAGPTMRGYQQSPYLQQMADRITQQSTQALNEGVLPGIRSQAVAAGGYGGSRQGIGEGLAIGRSQEALQGNLANLFNSDYQADRNRALQEYAANQQYNLGMGQLDATNRGIDNQYSLGLGNLSLGNRQADNTRYGIDQTYNLGLTNAANNRYGTDKSYEVGMANANASAANAAANQAMAQGNLALGQQRLGMEGLFGALDRQYTYGQGALQSANTMQNTPVNYWQTFGQGANALGQNGGSSMTTATNPSNPLAGMIGGAQLANGFFNQMSSPVAANNNVYFGTGSMAD